MPTSRRDCFSLSQPAAEQFNDYLERSRDTASHTSDVKHYTFRYQGTPKTISCRNETTFWSMNRAFLPTQYMLWSTYMANSSPNTSDREGPDLQEPPSQESHDSDLPMDEPNVAGHPNVFRVGRRRGRNSYVYTRRGNTLGSQVNSWFEDRDGYPSLRSDFPDRGEGYEEFYSHLRNDWDML